MEDQPFISLFDIEVPHAKIKKYYISFQVEGWFSAFNNQFINRTYTTVIPKPKYNLLIESEFYDFQKSLIRDVEAKEQIRVTNLVILTMLPFVA